jgi:hypothetical protein
MAAARIPLRSSARMPGVVIQDLCTVGVQTAARKRVLKTEFPC